MSLAERDFRIALHRLPETRDRSRRRQANAVVAACDGIRWVVLSALLTIFYALPFGRAVSVEEFGGISGELLLALTYGLVLVASGRWVWRRVNRDYRHRMSGPKAEPSQAKSACSASVRWPADR